MNDSILIKYRINGTLYRRRYEAHEHQRAQERLNQYRLNGIEIVSVQGMPNEQHAEGRIRIKPL